MNTPSTPQKVAIAKPLLSPWVIATSAPGGHWAGDGGQVPTTASRIGTDTIRRIPYTIASPAMKYTATASGRPWWYKRALTANATAAIPNGINTAPTRLLAPKLVMNGATAPTATSAAAIQNDHTTRASR